MFDDSIGYTVGHISSRAVLLMKYGIGNYMWLVTVLTSLIVKMTKKLHQSDHDHSLKC